MRLGIIQGRLSPPANGFQECPDNWRREIELLDSVGIDHVEWIITKDRWTENPIWLLPDIPQNTVSSICVDALVDSEISNSEYVAKHLSSACSTAHHYGISRVTIPLLEKSSVEDPRIRLKFLEGLLPFLKGNPGLDFSFETELGLDKVEQLLVTDNTSLTYDTGNTTSYGIRHKEYIERFHDRISNVHLKDRKMNGTSVKPFTGDTDFDEIFKLLAMKNYDKDFTMQFARGDSGEEEQLIATYATQVRNKYDEHLRQV